ncbi:MAG: hypothetical protein HZB51_16660 [Chloroflexi bacterium]|nr:hypothetical protein [Chloroflexota bacterium]
MKANWNVRWLGFFILLALLVGLLPAPVANADEYVGTFFFGTIQSLPNTTDFIGDWKINNVIVHVTPNTVVDQQRGSVAIGALVAAQGWCQPDGSIDGTFITVIAGVGDQAKFFGIVKVLPTSTDLTGDWTVIASVNQSVIVHVSGATKIDETKAKVAVGAFVKVEGVLKDDQSVDATNITVMFTPTELLGKPIAFFGKIESLPSGSLYGEWTVSGIKVNVPAGTPIDQTRAQAAVGAFVQVKGTVQSNGSVTATEIVVRSSAPPTPINKYIKFYGIVQSLPSPGPAGSWVVSGITVNVTNQTQIQNGPAKVGSIVEVKGYLQANGSIDAVQIIVKGTSGPTSSPFGQSSAVGH